ncbi:MAG: preprotein translocase subunit SecG [Microgenomates group bacterium]
MENIVLTVHLILALLMIGVVLLQRSEGGGLGMGSGGGGGAISGRAAATALGKITWVLAACFIATSITLTIMAANRAGSDSVANQLGIDAPASATAPATDTPAVKPEDLLPPVPADAPATPAKVED